MCVDFIFSNDFAADAVLEQFLLSAFVYLAVNVENSTEIMQLILEILFSSVGFKFFEISFEIFCKNNSSIVIFIGSCISKD